MRIHRLPMQLVDQIAAGEVIDELGAVELDRLFLRGQ